MRTRMMKIAFCYNPTSWDKEKNAPVPGGMADALVQPILEHLPSGSWMLVDRPQGGVLNVYYAHRHRYPDTNRREIGSRSVFVSHGIADKAWREASRVSSRFDFVVVSGPAWTGKMLEQGMPADQVLELGYCKLDPIFGGKITPPDRRGDRRIRVVWAPTHGGGGERHIHTPPTRSKGAAVSTWWRRDEIMALLPADRFDVVEAPHPRHRPDRRSTLEEYVGADVVIADGGSTIYEAWALDLPVVLPSWLVGHANITRVASGSTFEAMVYRDGLGYQAPAADQLADVVERAANNGIRAEDRVFVEAIFPKAYRGTSGERHAAALIEIAAGRLVPDVRTSRTPSAPMVEYRHRTGASIKVFAGSQREQRLVRYPEWTKVEAEAPADQR